MFLEKKGARSSLLTLVSLHNGCVLSIKNVAKPSCRLDRTGFLEVLTRFRSENGGFVHGQVGIHISIVLLIA